MAQTVHQSFRLPKRLVRALERRARETGESKTSLVQRYADEGLRMDAHPQIVFREGAGGRRPALPGHRLDVWQVIETLKLSRNSIEEAAGYLGLPEHLVRACVRYYAQHKAEIDSYTRRMHDFAEREEAAWRREQEALA